MSSRILVVGAGGVLGGAAAGKLLDRGLTVRGMSRDPARLHPLAARGAEVVQGDLLDLESLARACADVDQVFSTANSFMGRGRGNPARVDVPGYAHLLEACRQAGVSRLVHTSAYGLTRDNPVDFFRAKAQIDELIRESDLPWVLLRPSAFLDVWAGMLVAEAVAGRPVRLFGDGHRVANYIAVADVAEFAVRILEEPALRGEAVDVGGPSTLSQIELVEHLEAALGRPVARRHLPLPVLRFAAAVLRPFNEMGARLAALGAWSAGADRPLDHWRVAADRFGVEPMTAEEFFTSIGIG